MKLWLFAWLLALISCNAPHAPKRFGSVIGLRAEKLDEYKRLHAAVWPEVARAVRDAHIRNYSIFLRKLPDGNHYLFSYLEYAGSDYQADMAKLAAAPRTAPVISVMYAPFPEARRQNTPRTNTAVIGGEM